MASPTCRTLSLSLTSTQHGEAGKGNLVPAPEHTHTHTQFLLSGEDTTKNFSGVRDTEVRFQCPWCLTLVTGILSSLEG